MDREINQLNEQFRTSEATRQYNKYMKLYKQTIEDGKQGGSGAATDIIIYKSN